MTTPDERTRALRWAWEFLFEIQSKPDAEPELRRQANAILRHYPTPDQIRAMARSSRLDEGMPWLTPEIAAPDGQKSSDAGDPGRTLGQVLR